jgi:hypothetical protein
MRGANARIWFNSPLNLGAIGAREATLAGSKGDRRYDQGAALIGGISFKRPNGIVGGRSVT